MKSLAGSGGSFGQLLRMSASYPDLKMPAPDLAHHQPKPAAHGFMSLFSALLYGSVAIGKADSIALAPRDPGSGALTRNLIPATTKP